MHLATFLVSLLLCDEPKQTRKFIYFFLFLNRIFEYSDLESRHYYKPTKKLYLILDIHPALIRQYISILKGKYMLRVAVRRIFRQSKSCMLVNHYSGKKCNQSFDLIPFTPLNLFSSLIHISKSIPGSKDCRETFKVNWTFLFICTSRYKQFELYSI